MSWDEIGTLAEILAAVGVIVSLLYVGKQVRASTEQAISDRLSENMMLGASSELGDLLIRGLADVSAMTEAEHARALFFMSGWLRTLEQAHRQYRRGFLDKDIWTGYEKYLASIHSTALMQGYWRERREIFNPEFRKLVDGFPASTRSLDFGIASRGGVEPQEPLDDPATRSDPSRDNTMS